MFFNDLIPVIAMLLVLGPPSAFLFSITPIGRALVDRLRGRTGDADPERMDEMFRVVLEIQDAVYHQGDEIRELSDRIGFTERLLAGKSEGVELPHDVTRGTD